MKNTYKSRSVSAAGLWPTLAKRVGALGLMLAVVGTMTYAQPTSTAAPLPASVKGGNVSAWNMNNVAKVFDDAKRLGLNTITVPVRVKMVLATSVNVTIDAASLAFAKSIVATNDTYSYIIEPYPWISGGNVAETLLNPSDKRAWFASYQTALLTLAKEFPTASGMYVASNLINVESESASWIALMNAVRAVFRGKIIYRTQWWATAPWAPETMDAYKAKLENPLFGVTDVIAIAAYFEVTDLPNPTTAQIKAALRETNVFERKQDIYTEIMAFQTKWKKPIFLGELSCPAVNLAAKNPWNPAVSTVSNSEIQKNYLTAYLETFAAPAAKFMGFSLFTIGHPTPTPYELMPSAAEYIRGYKPQ